MKGLCQAFLFTFFILQMCVSLCMAQEPCTHVVILSGGNRTSGLSASQYKTSQTIYAWAQRQSLPTLVFFGAGTQSPNEFGSFPENHPFTSAGLKILTSISSHDNLIIFGSGHGTLQKNSQGITAGCLVTWDESQSTNNKKVQCIGANELLSLTQPKNKNLYYIFTSCFSGGFHDLAIKNKNGYPAINPHICGTTATLSNMLASGCSADILPDSAKDTGYEALLAQYLDKIGSDKKFILADWHAWSKKNDHSIDVPLSTYDAYLLAWYDVISAEDFTPRSGKISGLEIANIRDKLLQSPWPIQALKSTHKLPAGKSINALTEDLNHINEQISAISEKLRLKNTKNQVQILRQKGAKLDAAYSSLLRQLLQKRIAMAFYFLNLMQDQQAIADENHILKCMQDL